MNKTVFLKQEFRGKEYENSSLPLFIEIVGEGEKMVKYECEGYRFSQMENVYISKDMRNYPKHFVAQYYNI